jgi:hypothetical protein
VGIPRKITIGMLSEMGMQVKGYWLNMQMRRKR